GGRVFTAVNITNSHGVVGRPGIVHADGEAEVIARLRRRMRRIDPDSRQSAPVPNARGALGRMLIRGAFPLSLGHGLIALSDLRPDLASYQIIDGRMDAAPNTRNARLIGRIVIGSPLQRHRRRRALFKTQYVVAESAQATWEVR